MKKIEGSPKNLKQLLQDSQRFMSVSVRQKQRSLKKQSMYITMRKLRSQQRLPRQKLKLNLKNIVLFKIGCSCLTLISTCWNWKRMRRSSSIDIKISTCQGRVHGSWGISRGEK